MLKLFLALKVRLSAPVGFLDVKDANKILILFFPQVSPPNSLSAKYINNSMTDVGLVLSIKVSGAAILLKPQMKRQ